MAFAELSVANEILHGWEKLEREKRLPYDQRAQLGEGFVAVIQMPDGEEKQSALDVATEDCRLVGMSRASTHDLYMQATEIERLRREGPDPHQIRIMDEEAAADGEVATLVATVSLSRQGYSYAEICEHFGGEYQLELRIGTEKLKELRDKEEQ